MKFWLLFDIWFWYFAIKPETFTKAYPTGVDRSRVLRAGSFTEYSGDDGPDQGCSRDMSLNSVSR